MPVALKFLVNGNSIKPYKRNRRRAKGRDPSLCSVTASYSHLPELISDFRLQHPLLNLSYQPVTQLKQSTKY